MKDCDLGTEVTTTLPSDLSYAMGYVPFQINPSMYSAEEGFERGTIFPDLFKPFTGKRGDSK